MNDIQNSRSVILFGSNPAEAHPVSLLHILKAKEQNNAPLIVCDPRFTRTAAHADEFVQMRPGTDVPLVWGILWHILENGWEDKRFIQQRVFGMNQIRSEVKKWNPKETERVTGIPGSQLKRVARTLAIIRWVIRCFDSRVFFSTRIFIDLLCGLGWGTFGIC